MMKKRLISLFLLLTMLLGMTDVVSAAGSEDQYGKKDWSVTFTKEEKMESNFGVKDFDDPISNMQPGDTVYLTVAIKNEHEKDTDWYMSNEILTSLEDASGKAENGAYTYRLSYTDRNGKESVFYDSDAVGGTGAKEEGLHGVSDHLKDYFWIDKLPNHGTGTVTLAITLDGESQNNGYMDTLAELSLNFAVELKSTASEDPDDPGEDHPPKIVKTGDETNLMVYFIIAGISGVIFLILAILSLRSRKKEKEAKEARK